MFVVCMETVRQPAVMFCFEPQRAARSLRTFSAFGCKNSPKGLQMSRKCRYLPVKPISQGGRMPAIYSGRFTSDISDIIGFVPPCGVVNAPACLSWCKRRERQSRFSFAYNGQKIAYYDQSSKHRPAVHYGCIVPVSSRHNPTSKPERMALYCRTLNALQA